MNIFGDFERKKFAFTYRSNRYILDVPIDNGFVITNEFCPLELHIGYSPLLKRVVGSYIHGEKVEEFILDCKKLVLAVSISNEYSKIDRYKSGLISVVREHIDRCGRLIFGDLLIYVDCFSHILKADGYADIEIQLLYPTITKMIADAFPESVKTDSDLSQFNESSMYTILSNLSKD